MTDSRDSMTASGRSYWRWPTAFPQFAMFAGAIDNALSARRLIVLIPFGAICGLLIYRLLPSEPQLWALGVAGAFLVAACIVVRAHLVALRLVVIALSLWSGFSLLPLHGALFGTEMLYAPAYGTYSGTVTRVLNSSGGAQRVILSELQALEGSRDPIVRRARLFVRSGPDISHGDVVQGRMRLAPVPSPVVPGGYDSQFHGYFDGVGAFGNTLGAPTVIKAENAFDVLRFIDTIRRAVGQRIDQVLEPPEAAIARALTIGDQSGISDDVRDTMATAGLAHVLAISGLHLTLVAGGVFLAIRRGLGLSYSLSLRWPLKKIGAVAGIAAALFYLALSGASVSAIRATLMLILVFGAVLAERQALTMRNVALAALVLIAIDPSSIFRPGFQLSFAAVVGLVGVYEVSRDRSDHQRSVFGSILRFFGGLAATSLIAGLATLLFAAYHFQQTAPLGIVGNMLALPLVGFVVLPSAFVSVMLMPLGLEWPFLSLMGWGISIILGIAEFVAGASGGISGSPLLSPIALIVGLTGLAWFAFFTGRERYAGPLATIPFVILFGLDRPPDILIADTTQAVAVRDTDGFGLISGQTGSFAVDAWSETYMAPIVSTNSTAQCDSIGCFVTAPGGFSVALVKDIGGFDDDCRIADLVIARIPATASCRTMTQVIDQYDLQTGGVHWAAWDVEAGEFEIRPAITDTGRPWRPGSWR